MRPHKIIAKQIVKIASRIYPRKINLIIAGTIKGGTTVLDEYLRSHPQIGMCEIRQVNNNLTKEARFFDNDELFKNGTPDYSAYHELFSKVWLQKILGDATPNYMFAPAAMQRIRAYNPETKIILTLRNPITRAYSHWNMNVQLKREKRTFSEAIRNELSVKSLAGSESTYICRGFYSEQIEWIWNLFPKQQTLIFKSEDLRNDHFNLLNRVCHFLGVSEQKYIPEKESHKRTYEKPMSPEDRKLLKEIFSAEINKLEKLLDWDCKRWLED